MELDFAGELVFVFLFIRGFCLLNFVAVILTFRKVIIFYLKIVNKNFTIFWNFSSNAAMEVMLIFCSNSSCLRINRNRKL